MLRTSVLIAGLFAVLTAPVFAGGGGALPFVKDVAKAEAEAKPLGLARVYYFTASW